MLPRTTRRVWFCLLPLLLAIQTLCFLGTRVSAQSSDKPMRAAKPAPPSAPAIAGLDESKGCIVPFTWDPPVHPFIIVQVRINKSRALPFIVDTGADALVYLMPWAAQELKLQTGKNMPPRFGGNVVSQQVTTNCQVNILTFPGPAIDFNTDNVYVTPFPVFENAATPRIAGIIGVGLFHFTTGRFDFDKKTLTFFADKHAPLTPSPLGVSLPLTQPDPTWARVNLSLQAGKPMSFLLDTGSTNTILPAGSAEGLKYLAEGASAFDDAAGHQVVRQLLLRSLPLGSLFTPLVSASLPPQAKQGLLGLDVLTRFRVTLDIRNGSLLLEPRRQFLSSLQGEADISLNFRDGNTYLDQVLRVPNLLDIARGDRLLSIDGVDLSGQTYVETYLRLNGTAGTTALLTLEKPDHRKVTVPWLRISQFSTVIVTPLGLLLTKEEKQAARVLAVVPGSEAESAGLQAGDAITTVDGVAVEPMAFNALQGLFADDEHGSVNFHKFTVKRDKADAILTFHLEKGTLHKS